MLEDIKDSIKAKLYDFAYTPFMSSVLISWIVLNHKYLLIYFSNYDLVKKLALLKEYDFSEFNIPYAFNILIPILFGLFYVFIYPFISKIFYSYTLEQGKKLKAIKKQVEDNTPLTREEEIEIRKELDRLTVERDEIQNRLTKTEQFYEEKYQKKVDELSINARGKTSIFPETNILKSTEEDTIEEDDRTKILRYFYEGNYSGNATSGALADLIVNYTKLPRPKIEILIKQLVNDHILIVDRYGYHKLSDTGNRTLIELFDKKREN